MSDNIDLANRKIDNQAMARRFERELQRRVTAIIDKHLDRLGAIVRRGGTQREIARALRAETRAFSVRVLREIEPDLRRYASTQGKFESDSLRRQVGRIYRIRDASLTQLRGLVDTTPLRDSRVLRQHFVNIGIAERMRVESEVRRGRLERLTAAQIATRIASGPTAKVTRLQARSIVRTAVTQIATNASRMAYEANSDILRGYQYVATLDSRTTPICARNDGRIFALDADYQPRPPLHWNCRSTTVPVLKRFSEVSEGVIRRLPTDAQRASINGPVSGRQNYGEWLAKQPFEIQLRHLMDPARVRLFRQGNLRLTQFSDVDGELLSIERLEGLNRRATGGG